MTIELAQAPASASMPHDLDAEQAVLGCILFDNGIADRLGDLKPEHFYEPVHARMFAAIEGELVRGGMSDPIAVNNSLRNDEALEALGGLRYLADLVNHAPPSSNAPRYAGIITDLAIRRAVIRIADEANAEAREGEDAGLALVEKIEGQLYALAEHGKTSSGFETFATALTGALAMAGEAYSRDGGLSGLSTGLLDLDQKMGGLHPSDLVVLAARPSMGKTALACNIAFNVARRYAYEDRADGTRKTTAGGVVGFFSLEMSGEQLATRLLAEVSGVPSDKIRTGRITAVEYGHMRDAAIEISNAPLHIDDTGGLSIAKLAARARRLKRTSGLDLIVVDYLQLVTPSSSRRGDNRVQEVSEVTAALKALAKELEVPILALAQLSRQVEQREDKRPQLADLRESGSIEQDADAVLFIYREAYYLGRAEPREGTSEHLAWQDAMKAADNLAEVIIGKQRHGPIGTVRLAFNEELTKFGNLARDGRYDGRGVRPAYGDE